MDFSGRSIKLVLLLGLIALGGHLLENQALAQTTAPQGELALSEPAVASEHRDWSVFEYQEKGRRVCYAGATPISRRGKTQGQPDSWLLVTNDPTSGLRHSVSFELGSALKSGTIVRASVNKRTFELVPEGTAAWTANDSMDLRLIVAMKRGRRILISAQSNNGSRVLDTFSLMGFSGALNAASTHCR
ncbi:MAG: invasion protein IalB [Gammaproteobacteria bacterium]|jgi:invasion protein IalB